LYPIVKSNRNRIAKTSEGGKKGVEALEDEDGMGGIEESLNAVDDGGRPAQYPPNYVQSKCKLNGSISRVHRLIQYGILAINFPGNQDVDYRDVDQDADRRTVEKEPAE